MNKQVWLSLFFGLALLAPVGGEAQDGSPPPNYVIGPQDQLSITVFEEAELTGKYRVDNDGYFSFPLLERVRAAGRTLSEVQSTLTAMLANGFLRSPQFE